MNDKLQQKYEVKKRKLETVKKKNIYLCIFYA